MSRYRLNASNVVHDLIDGEVLAIRSDTGSYYSMTGSTASAWLAVISGRSLAIAAHDVAVHHGADVADVADVLHTFADTLVGERLVAGSDDSEPETGTTGTGALQFPADTAGTAWSTPAFEKYTDMQDLLLFDPIHEVQDTGWPHAANS